MNDPEAVLDETEPRQGIPTAVLRTETPKQPRPIARVARRKHLGFDNMGPAQRGRLDDVFKRRFREPSFGVVFDVASELEY